MLNDPRVLRALSSAINQKHSHDMEIIVVDGGSTDDATLSAIDKYKGRIDALLTGPDKGIFDGMNRGIEVATGDIIGILNADDWYHDLNVVKDVLDTFENPQVDACYGDLGYIGQNGETVRKWQAGPYRRWKLYHGWMPPHPTFFVRRKLYDQYGIFKLEYPIASDYDLVIRMLFKFRINIAYLPRTIVNMSPGGASGKSLFRILESNLEVLKICRSYGMKGWFLIPVMKPLIKLIQFVKPKFRLTSQKTNNWA